MVAGQGRASRFQRGRISWHPALGAALLRQATAVRYEQLGAEGGVLGFPTADEAPAPGGGTLTPFQQGRISSSVATGAWEVRGALAAAFVALGAEGGPLGYPVEGQLDVAGGQAARFQGGRLSAGPATGMHAVLGPLAVAYEQNGAEARTPRVPRRRPGRAG